MCFVIASQARQCVPTNEKRTGSLGAAATSARMKLLAGRKTIHCEKINTKFEATKVAFGNNKPKCRKFTVLREVNVEKLTSRRNQKCVHVKNLGKSKEYRNEHGEFLCDGKKLLEEAIKSKATITGIFTTSPIREKLPNDTPVYLIEESIMETLSPLKNPQGILFTCKIPDTKDPDLKKGTHILLDNVQDPGNVGTIIRSADAFGIDSVLLTQDSADPYNPKTVRATMGAIFRQNVLYIETDKLKSPEIKVIGTGNKNGEYNTLSETKLQNAVIILGNEGQGISEKLKVLCDEMITIPLSKGCESLNVSIAASIIMWEAGKEWS